VSRHSRHRSSASEHIENPGIDRRTLIKGAAVAGAVAWTAPVIIDSLSSPAAAATGIHGCTQIRINGSCALDSQGATGTCAPLDTCTGTQDATLLANCVTLPSSCDGTSTVVFTTALKGCESCTFTAATARWGGNNCSTPPVPPVGPVTGIGTNTVTFAAIPASENKKYDQFFLNVTCV
jgi:hypothetical protein